MRNSFFTLLVLSTLGLVASPVSATSTVCQVGYAWNGNNCQQCQAGQSSDGQGGGCKNCPANYFSQPGGSCTVCPDGYGSQPGSQCQKCPDGFFSTGGSGCKSCSDGSISKSGDASCSPCKPGTYANQAHTACQECSAGTFQPAFGTTQCRDCPVGYFQGFQGKTECNICPCGTYKSSTRGTVCDSCGNGPNGVLLSSPQGSVSQSQCFVPTSAQYLDGDRCTATCPAGQVPNKSGGGTPTSCTSCGSNAVAQPGSATCTNCDVGYGPDATKATCTPTSTAHARKRHLREPFCPQGHQACTIVRGRQKVFECVKTSSDLTSCGGCPGTEGAEDCTAFDPLATASCVRGKCQYSCPRGFNLTNTGCQPMTNGAKLRSKTFQRYQGL